MAKLKVPQPPRYRGNDPYLREVAQWVESITRTIRKQLEGEVPSGVQRLNETSVGDTTNHTHTATSGDGGNLRDHDHSGDAGDGGVTEITTYATSAPGDSPANGTHRVVRTGGTDYIYVRANGAWVRVVVS